MSDKYFVWPVEEKASKDVYVKDKVATIRSAVGNQPYAPITGAYELYDTKVLEPGSTKVDSIFEGMRISGMVDGKKVDVDLLGLNINKDQPQKGMVNQLDTIGGLIKSSEYLRIAIHINGALVDPEIAGLISLGMGIVYPEAAFAEKTQGKPVDNIVTPQREDKAPQKSQGGGGLGTLFFVGVIAKMLGFF